MSSFFFKYVKQVNFFKEGNIQCQFRGHNFECQHCLINNKDPNLLRTELTYEQKDKTQCQESPQQRKKKSIFPTTKIKNVTSRCYET